MPSRDIGECAVRWAPSTGVIKISVLLAQTIRICGRCVLRSHLGTCFHLSNWREPFSIAEISRIRIVSNVLTRFAEICASVGCVRPAKPPSWMHSRCDRGCAGLSA